MTFIDDLNDTSNALSGSAQQIVSNKDFDAEGFVVSSGTPNADGSGLPSGKISKGRHPATFTRRIVHWFVPEFGVVKMYINPQTITYNFRKLTNRVPTKGGYVIQYWGEELPTLSIVGMTGSSGVEGLNVLYEVYRAEQYAFDSLGLTMAANSAVSGAQSLLDSAGDALFGKDSIGGDIASTVTGGLLGVDPTAGLPVPSNVPTLASLALGVEMFYDGWVFRGYFESMVFTESATDIGNFNYTMNFVVTQRRGYRVNYMPWHRSAIDGPSNNSISGVPMTFSGAKD